MAKLIFNWQKRGFSEWGGGCEKHPGLLSLRFMFFTAETVIHYGNCVETLELHNLYIYEIYTKIQYNIVRTIYVTVLTVYLMPVNQSAVSNWSLMNILTYLLISFCYWCPLQYQKSHSFWYVLTNHRQALPTTASKNKLYSELVRSRRYHTVGRMQPRPGASSTWKAWCINASWSKQGEAKKVN